MRIVYGSHTQGQGGLAKAAVLVAHLESLGHEVCVVTSGLGMPPGFRFRNQQHFPGLEYVVARGQTDYLRTFLRWTGEIPRLFGSLRRLQRLCDEFRPDLVISDFEPLTASPLLRPRCEVLSVSRPTALIDSRIPLPEGAGFERRMARSVIRLFSSGADRRYGYHFEPSSHRCVPPIVGTDVERLRPQDGEHLLVYNVYHTNVGSPADLVAWADRTRRPVVAYGFPEVTNRKRVGFVEFRNPGRESFLRDLATCRAVIATAGLCLPVEACWLRKPVCVVPIPGQWEQRVNAFHLHEAGLARWLEAWDYSAALDTPAPDSQLLEGWLRGGAAYVLRRLLPAGADRPLEECPRVAA